MYLLYNSHKNFTPIYYVGGIPRNLWRVQIILLGSWTGTILYSKAVSYKLYYNRFDTITGLLVSSWLGGALGVYLCRFIS